MQFVAECGNPLEQNTRPNLVFLSNQNVINLLRKMFMSSSLSLSMFNVIVFASVLLSKIRLVLVFVNVNVPLTKITISD